MKLIWIDWVIIVVTLVICFFPALLFGRRAGKKRPNSSRRPQCALVAAGLSMVATTFSSDTPIWLPTSCGARAWRATGVGGRSR